LNDIPDNHLRVKSSLGSVSIQKILAMPLILDNNVKGVIELGQMFDFTEAQTTFLQQVSGHIALALHTAQGTQKTRDLLVKTQTQAEELEVQQEELREANDRLLAQEEELRVSNEELSEKSQNLEKQRDAIEQSNQELEAAKKELLRKAQELEVSSKYKSEFLANMSHELRTPLNSLLLISNRLSRNKEQNLTEKQVESARIIHNSGQELLALINDVLDLAKIEAGKLDIVFQPIRLTSIKENVEQLFSSVAEEKGLTFSVNLDPKLKDTILTDRQRLEQILRNLIGNALKFTEHGGVTVLFSLPENTSLEPTVISGLTGQNIVFEVIDTGIGISIEKHSVIFEAFQQEDGTTSRKYGGTGLGLSITRELSHLLGGEIFMSSSEGKGSIFSLVLPVEPPKDRRRTYP